MARVKKGQAGSSYTYFRTLFDENPQWLDSKSNDLILARYRADHGLAEDAAVEKAVKNNLANLKSMMRKKARTAEPARAANSTTGGGGGRGGSRLEALEEMIDECLTLAKTQDREGLQDVIGLLRRARNEVVWKLGQ